QDGDAPAPSAAQVLGEEDRLLLQGADLVVEHVLAPGHGAARVVDAGHAGFVGEVAHDQAVVADGGTHDGHDSLVDEGVEVLDHRRSGARRQTLSLAPDQLDLLPYADAGARLFHPEAEPALEVAAAVAFGE